MKTARRFKQTGSVPRQPNEQARLKCVGGPDSGAIFVLSGARASIGRGEENDVVVLDLKASRRHAELSLGAGGWTIKDTGSANGFVINQQPSRLATLKNGDLIALGETILEFVGGEAATQMLVAPPRAAGQVAAEQAVFQQQRARVRSMAQGAPRPQLTTPTVGGAGPNKRVLLYGGAAVALALVVMLGSQDDGEKPKKKPAAAAGANTRDLASYLPGGPGDKAAETFIKAGFREYRERNYLRAKLQFETVLQMVPGHPLATLYLDNCNKGIQEETKFHLDRGRLSLQAGRLREAKGHYEAILRLLSRDQSNPAFAEAREQLDKVEKKMKGIEETGGAS